MPNFRFQINQISQIFLALICVRVVHGAPDPRDLRYPEGDNCVQML